MNFDTYTPFGQIHANGEEFTTQLLDVSKHVILREKTQKWAHNLRFLCVPKTSTPCTSASNNTKQYESETCRQCESWSVFPDKPLDYLWLTDYGEIPDCIHYIAVSYCWRQPGGDVPVERPFDIMTNRGRRQGRAPRNIVSRAIKYASYYGIRLIWIDQECIEQDNREDKEYGIQSMDLVYSRSLYPLGLLNTHLTEASQLDGLAHILARGEAYFKEDVHPSYENTPHSEMVQHLEAVEILAEDKWFTRTWIFQEATLASERLVFLVPCAHSIRHPSFEPLPGEVMLNADSILKFSIGGVHIVEDFLSRLRDQPDSTWKLRFLKTEHFLTDRLAVGAESLSHVCNAGTVVHLVSMYDNKRVLDRLAIIANLCEYPIRIKTSELEDKNYSFSTCLLAMTLLNGDISFLQFWHEMSHFPSREIALASKKTNMSNENFFWQTFSWAPSQMASIQPVYAQPSESPTRLVGSSLTRHGLAMQGWMWDVDQRIDLDDLRLRFRESWETVVAECGTTFPQKWDDIRHFIRHFLQTLEHKELFDIYDQILSKAIKSMMKHRPVTPNGSEREAEKLTIPEDSKVTGDDMVDLPSTSTTMLADLESIFKKPEDFESYNGLLCDDFAIPLIEQPWVWIIPMIMKQGFLYFGRLLDSKGNLRGHCSIFEHQYAGYFLTPRVCGEKPDEVPLGFEDRPNSWIVQPSNETVDGMQIVKGRGMVRGLWKIGQAEPQNYVLS